MKQINISMKEYIPAGAKNIRIIWNGEDNCNGDLIRLDGITIWFEEEEEEKPLSLQGKVPEVKNITLNGKKIWVVRICTEALTLICCEDTRAKAIQEWNKILKSFK